MRYTLLRDLPGLEAGAWVEDVEPGFSTLWGSVCIIQTDFKKYPEWFAETKDGVRAAETI